MKLETSVEAQSYVQMNDIFKYGHYKIGREHLVMCNDLNEVIALNLESDRSYSLEDLRNLEVKLGLVTGRNAKNRKRVKHFLAVSSKYRATYVRTYVCTDVEQNEAHSCIIFSSYVFCTDANLRLISVDMCTGIILHIYVLGTPI